VRNLIYVKGTIPGYAGGEILELEDSPSNPLFKDNPPSYPTYVPGVHPDLPEVEDLKIGGTDPLDYKCSQVD
jgi:hypothetical protein